MPALGTPDASQWLLEVQVVTSKTQTHADRLDLSLSVPWAPISASCVQLLKIFFLNTTVFYTIIPYNEVNSVCSMLYKTAF